MLRTWFIPLTLALSFFLFPEAVKAVDIAADTITRGSDGVIIAEGDVIIEREGETLAAEKVIYDTENRKIEAHNNVVITSKGATIRAESGELHTTSKVGELHHAEATMKDGERLRALLLKRDKNSIITAKNAIITSCPPDAEAWLVKTDYAELDQDNALLTGRNATFEVGGIPVLYTPYWQQVLRRKSGFLTPNVSSGKVRGTEVALPYYFAPAKNWDATLTPHWMSARGLKGDIELRHVSPLGYEEIQIEGINDKLSSRQRGRVRADIRRRLPYDMALSVKADNVSDYNYLADFETDNKSIAKPYLQSNVSLSQSFENGNWNLSATHQQTMVQSSNAETLQILPRFESQMSLPFMDDKVMFNFDQQSTQFSRALGVDGWRVDLNPYLEIPWQLSGGGMQSTLQVGARHTRYWLNDAAGLSNLARNTFEASLDVRSNFERVSSNRLWRHWITPVLRYDRITAPDQSALPNFDSAFGSLSMSNLLNGNRFTGKDRIERLNRISALIETGLQHKDEATSTARSYIEAKLGVAYDMQRKSVDPTLLTASTRPFSNLLGEIALYPTKYIRLSADGQYDPVDKFWSTSYAAMNIDSQTGHVLNMSWQRTDARYAAASELADVSATTQLAQRWSAFGRLQYDLRLKLTQQASAGFHYQHPCWDVRVEGYRVQLKGVTAATSDFGFRFLLGFKGLGSVGG